MALFNYAKRELNAKIVFYGPGLCGKTTNIQHVHAKLNPDSRGKLLSLATQTDRTLFFDFLPVELGEIKGLKTRFHLYTVPGQVFYNATRKMVLKGADGIVFVADSQPDMSDANLESLKNLRDNLAEYGISLDEIPYVIQYNKRDLPDVIPIDEMDRQLNPDRVPAFGACALQGKGVLPTLTTICKMVLKKLRDEQGLVGGASQEVRAKAASYKAMRQGGAQPQTPAARRQQQAATPTLSTEKPPLSQAHSRTPEAPPDAAKRPAAAVETTESRVAAPKEESPYKIELVGRSRPVSDNELLLPVLMKGGDNSRRLMLRVRLNLEGERATADIAVEEKE